MKKNEKKKKIIAFNMKDEELAKKIDEYRELYGGGQRGMVTWPGFCAFLGYSVEQVREVYLRGREGVNAYNNRSDMIGRFYTELKGMVPNTARKQQSLARAEIDKDYLTPPDSGSGGKSYIFLIESSDGRVLRAAD